MQPKKPFRPTKQYLKCYQALHGDSKALEGLGASRDTPKKKKRPVDPLNPFEEQEQITFVHWLWKNKIRHYHPANGGSRNYIEAIQLKRMGVVAGICDIVIPIGLKGYNHLYIELKRKKGGKVSQEQQDWIDWLNNNGSLAVVACGADEAIKIVEKYLK